MYLFLTILLSFSFSTVILVPEDYPTIQQGIDASIDGDSVIVFAGIYYEIINYNGKDIIGHYVTTENYKLHYNMNAQFVRIRPLRELTKVN